MSINLNINQSCPIKWGIYSLLLGMICEPDCRIRQLQFARILRLVLEGLL